MKVVVAGLLSDSFLEDLRASFPNVLFQPASTSEEHKFHIKHADVFFGYPSREVVVSAEKLRWIACPGTGIDQVVTIPEVVNSDVVLTNARGPHAEPMADHVLGMMLTFAHRARELRDDQKAHRWETKKYDGHMIGLNGQTMGILALGDIGAAVARRALGFGMKVHAVDSRPIPASRGVEGAWGLERLDELLGISDWFVVTAPFTSETQGVIDKRRIGLLKPGSYMVVISRGGIVDEDALIDALRTGRIAGAGLDATAREPLPSDSPLWDMDNVILSPHVSALTAEMWEGRRQVFKENLRRFLSNEPFLYVCDKQAGF